jgi:hypothetical protein
MGRAFLAGIIQEPRPALEAPSPAFPALSAGEGVWGVGVRAPLPHLCGRKGPQL